MKRSIQTGDACVVVDGAIKPISECVREGDKRSRLAALLAVERHLRDEIAHAGELMAHDSMRDQRPLEETLEGDIDDDC